jgi:hypothetical protein
MSVIGVERTFVAVFFLVTIFFLHHLSEYNSQTTNLLGCNKASEMTTGPVTVSSQAVVDVNMLVKQVSPRNTYFLRPQA